MTALIGALLLCLVFGALLDRALFDLPGAGIAERLGRGLLFGFGGVGSVALLLDSAGVPVRAASLLPALAVLAVPLLLAARRPRARSGATASAAETPANATPITATTVVGAAAGDDARPLTRGARLAHAGLVLFAAASLAQPVISGYVRPVFQFDSLTRWLFKAKVLAYEGTLRGAISTDPDFAFTHQRYPALLPQVLNLPALLSGRWDERIAEALCPWFAVALTLVVYGALRRRAGALKAALGAAWVASLPLIAYVPVPPAGSGAFSAMADIPLALFVTGAGLALLDALEGRRAHAHLEAGLCLGFAALTKNEGLPLLAGAALALLLGATRVRVRRVLGVLGVAGVLYLLAWGLLARRFPALDENYPDRLHLDALHEGLGRLPGVAGGFLGEMVSFQRWNVTWPAVVVLLAIGRLTRPRVALLAFVGLQLATYVLAFLITAWTSPSAAAVSPEDPVIYLMNLTLGRLLMHVAPLAIALALLAAPALVRPPVAAR